MTANSRQMKLLQHPSRYGQGARNYARHLLLLLTLLFSGLLLPKRPLAAATVVVRQTGDALVASGRHAVLPALLPGAEIAAPQPGPEPLPLPPALLPAALFLPAGRMPHPAPSSSQPIQPTRGEATVRLTSEVPNGP